MQYHIKVYNIRSIILFLNMSNNGDNGWTTVGGDKKPKNKKNNNNNERVYTGLNYEKMDNETVFKGGSSNRRVMPGEGVQFTKYGAGKNQQRKGYKDPNTIEKNAEEGNFKVDTVNHNLRMDIQRARQRKNLTQKDLADLSNLPLGTIRAYEKGTAIPNPNQLRAMSKVLGVTLSNKKK